MSEEYIDRLIEEKDELKSKVDKLTVFINENVVFENQHYEEQRRLINQRFVMTQYLSILHERTLHAQCDSCYEGYAHPTPCVTDSHGDGLYVKECFGFDHALRLLTQGNKLARKGWNGKGLWIELQVPDEHSKMTSPYAYITGMTGSKTPWVPSQSDLWAEDWMKV